MLTSVDITAPQYINVVDLTSKLLFSHILLIIWVTFKCFKTKFLTYFTFKPWLAHICDASSSVWESVSSTLQEAGPETLSVSVYKYYVLHWAVSVRLCPSMEANCAVGTAVCQHVRESLATTVNVLLCQSPFRQVLPLGSHLGNALGQIFQANKTRALSKRMGKEP